MEGGPPRFRPGFTCPALLRCKSCLLAMFRLRGYHPVSLHFPEHFDYIEQDLLTYPTTPTGKPVGLGSSHFARRYYGNLDLIYFPPPTKMFQFGGCRLFNLYYSVKDNELLTHWVAPFGDLRVKAIFQLTEAYRRLRVLHRLLMPRHPPAALISLTLNSSSFQTTSKINLAKTLSYNIY